MPFDPSTRPDSASLADGAGEPRRAEDRLDAGRLAELHALLDRPGPAPAEGAPLPPLWHAPFFRRPLRPEEQGEDGAPLPDGLPPETGLPLRRRGGGRIEFLAPLPVGAEAVRRSVLQNVALKQGGPAPVAVATLRHEIAGPGGVAIREEADILFRPRPEPGAPPRPRAPLRDERPAFSRQIAPDAVSALRFAALAGDLHRIHWDVAWAREVEGEPGALVPSGWLMLQLAELLRENSRRRLARLEWRVAASLPVGETARLCGRTLGRGAELWAVDAEDRLLLEARGALD